MQRREFAIHHDDPVFRHRHGDVSALAFEHIDGAAEIGGLDLDFGEIRRRRWCGWLLRDSDPGQQQGGCDRHYSYPKHENLRWRPFTDFLAHDCIVCASCEPRGSLLECGTRTKRRGLQDAVMVSLRGNEIMTSPIAGGVDCDLHPAV